MRHTYRLLASVRLLPGLCYDGKYMKSTRLEPGLLPLFRAYVVVRTMGLALVAMVTLPKVTLLLDSDILITAAIYLTEALFLLGYLSWPWAMRKLGRWYLPVAILVAAAAPIIEMRYIFSVYHVSEALDFWLIFPFLTVPLIVTAWQYSFDEVLLYCVGTTLLEPAMVALMATARQTNRWFDGGMLVVRMTFMIGIGYIVSYLVTEQRQQRRELAEANRKLIRYAAAQEQLATVRERNRLARELHDTLAHTLSALTVQLEALSAVWQPETPRARRFLAQALSTARTGLDETRRALQDLRAAPLDDLGLVLVIRNLAESVARRGALKLDLDLPEDLGNLPPDVENAFYRLAQEALENIVKHAEAQSVNVSLRQDGAHLTLVVADDGRGFLTGLTETDERFGLRGMRERAAQIGGALDITTRPTAGTVVRLSCEVKDKDYD